MCHDFMAGQSFCWPHLGKLLWLQLVRQVVSELQLAWLDFSLHVAQGGEAGLYMVGSGKHSKKVIAIPKHLSK